VQFSAASHTPAAARQTVALDANESAGQAALEPVQFSATSQVVAATRQTVELARKASAGHVVDEPVHVSATSQLPAEARHVAPALPAGCWHVSLEPSH
jgi:hypothetical protein